MELTRRAQEHETAATQRAAELSKTESTLRQMVALREAEEKAAQKVQEAMEEVQRKLAAETADGHRSAEAVAALQGEVEEAKAALGEKQMELEELRQEQADFETTTFNPTFVRLNQLQREAQETEEAIQSLLSRLPEDVIARKGLGELDAGRMITEWGMSDDPSDRLSPYALQESLLQCELPIRVRALGDEATYVFSDDAELVVQLRERHPAHAEAILGHLLEAHREFIGQSSAGTIVRVPWDFALGMPMAPARVLEAITRHLFPA